MKIAGVVLLAVASSAVTAMLMTASSSVPRSRRSDSGDVSSELDALRREHAALRAQMEELRTRSAVGDEAVEEVVARLLEEREVKTSKPVPATDVRAAMV